MAKRSKKKRAAELRPQPRSGSPRLPAWLPDATAVVVLFLVTWILFAPFLTEDARFSAGGDAAGARAWQTTSNHIAEQTGELPLWSPYVFAGFPIYGSLSYHAVPNFNIVEMVTLPLRYLYGTATVNREVLYFFLSGLFMYLFARGLGLGVLASLLAGLTLLLNPYNVSLMTAGHGSKHWTIAMMPLVFLLTHRALMRRRLLELGLLAIAISVSLLSLHVQIAYYTLLVAGLYALVWMVAQFVRREPGRALRGMGVFAGGSALGLGIAASLYLPVYVYQQFSIRGRPPLMEQGGPAGLDWQYATNWSLHPLETLQFLVPGAFGLGGIASPDQALVRGTADVLDYNLYWGWMPMTMSSLYMGIIPLALAILGAVWCWKRRPVVRWMAIASLLAVVVAFGRHLPLLYGPMYHALPFFAKFRVPSMILAVTAVGVAILAAYGLDELLRRLREPERAKRLDRLFYVLGGVSLLALFYGLFAGAVPAGGFLKAGELQQYGAQTANLLAELRWDLLLKSLRITSLVLLGFVVAVLAARRWGRSAMAIVGLVGVGAVALTSLDLLTLDARFLQPVPERSLLSGLAPDATVRELKKIETQSDEPFRIYPIGRDFQSNYWMYNLLQSIGGYAAVKLRVYQDLLDYALQPAGAQMPNLKLAGALNARYLVTSQPLPQGFEQLHADQRRQRYLYRNPLAMERAWFVDFVKMMPDQVAVMERLNDPGWDPRMEALLVDAPKMQIGQPDSLSRAHVPASRYTAHRFEIEASTPDHGFLVVSEMWYPQGWVATMDGEPVEIARVNYAMRGIAVPPGDHTIVMEFDPPEIRLGFVLSWISMILALALVGLGVWLEWRKNGQSEAQGRQRPESP